MVDKHLVKHSGTGNATSVSGKKTEWSIFDSIISLNRFVFPFLHARTGHALNPG
jgi:hypothetical protein